MKLSATSLNAGDLLQVDAEVKNTSDREGDEVAQLYLTLPKTATPQLHALKGVERVHLKPRETRRVHFALDPRQLSAANDNGDPVISAGSYRVTVGGGQPGTGAPQAEAEFSINGEQRLPE